MRLHAEGRVAAGQLIIVRLRQIFGDLKNNPRVGAYDSIQPDNSWRARFRTLKGDLDTGW